MKIVISAVELKEAFKALATAFQAGQKSVSSILSNPDYSWVKMTAFDTGDVLFEGAMEGVFARAMYKAQVLDPGTIVVACSYLYSLSYPMMDVEIETTGNNVKIKCGTLDVELNGILNPNALTINPVEEVQLTHTIPMDAFSSSRYQVAFPQMHTGSGKRPLIRHTCTNGQFGAEANDKYSLAISRQPIANIPDFNLVLPVGFEDGLLAIFGKAETFWLGMNEKSVRFTSVNFDVQFPRIQEEPTKPLVKDCTKSLQNILAMEQKVQFEFNAKDALMAVNTVSSLQYAAKAKQFRIILKIDQERVVVTTTTSFGKGDNSFAAKVTKGVGETISCHSSILQTFLALLSQTGVYTNYWSHSTKGVNTLQNDAVSYLFTSV